MAAGFQKAKSVVLFAALASTVGCVLLSGASDLAVSAPPESAAADASPEAAPPPVDGESCPVCGGCGPSCDPGFVCDGQCIDVLAALAGFRLELPCTGVLEPNGRSCPSERTSINSATVRGFPGKSYDVRLHFRGLVEQRTYVGGTSIGATGGQPDGGVNPEFFIAGGAVAGTDAYNLFTLEIQHGDAGTPRTFRLNAGTSSLNRVFPLDYIAELRVEAGEVLVFTADSLDDSIMANTDGNGNALVIPGVPPDPEPFNGQFVQIDVASVMPVP